MPEEEKTQPVQTDGQEQTPQEKDESVWKTLSEDTPPKAEEPQEFPESDTGKETPDDEPQTDESVQTDEQKEQREQLYQTRYQNVLEKLKVFNPAYYQEWMESPKDDPPQDNRTAAQQTFADDDGDVEDYVTKGDLKKMQDELRNVVTQGERQRRQKEFQQAYAQEYQSSNAVLEQIVKESGASQELAQYAAREAGGIVPDINQPGAPSKFVRVFDMVLRNALQSGGVSGNNDKATSDAEQKALAAKMVMQPDGAAGGMGENRELTREEKLIKAMHDTTRSDAKDTLFG